MNLRCVSNMQIIFSLILFKYGQQQIIEIQKKKIHKQKDVRICKSKITNKNFLVFNCKILYFTAKKNLFFSLRKRFLDILTHSLSS